MTAKVTGTLTVDVTSTAQAEAMKDDPQVKLSFASALAETAGVDPDQVKVTITVVYDRRLSSPRRLQGTARIVVTYEIIVPADNKEAAQSTANAVTNAIQATTPAALTTKVVQKIAESPGGSDKYDLNTLTVKEIPAPQQEVVIEVITLTRTATTTSASTVTSTTIRRKRASSFATSSKMLGLSHVVFVFALTASLVW